MRHHKHHGTESTARTDNVTVNCSIIILSARSDKRACRVPLYLQFFHSGIHNRAAGLKAHKRTCAVTCSRPHQIVDHFLSSQHVLRKRLTVERSQQSLCLLRLFLVSRPFTSFLSLLVSSSFSSVNDISKSYKLILYSTSPTRLRTVPHFVSRQLPSLACLRVHLSRKECSTLSSHINLRSSSTAPLQPISGQFPILNAAALACLPSGTSVAKRMLHVFLQH
jgi:hypothetical protein